MQKLTNKIYNDLAAQRNLQWWGDVYPDGPTPPDNLPVLLGEAKSYWRCTRCGKVHRKTYRSVMINRRNGCRCDSSTTMQPEAYEAVARELGLEWLRGEYLPRNTRTPQQWRVLATNKILTATYNEIAVEMPNKVKAALGLPYRRRGGDYSKRTADV